MNLNHSHGSPLNFRSERRTASKKVKRSRQYRERAARLRLGVESLEERALMALGPTLVAINPNTGSVLTHDNTASQTLNVAPTDLTFRFDDGQAIDPTTLAA